MRIFMTGATGLVGAHTALALLDAGHTLRLLARTPAKAQRWLDDHDAPNDRIEIIAGDMCDAALMETAMHDCDAVLHAAAMVSVDPRDADRVYQGNLDGLEAVIGTAIRLQIPNIVYVSSIAAIFQPSLPRIDEHTPLSHSNEAYMGSKIACEKRVRGWQQQGAPIHITYPSGVFAPWDPGANESTEALKTFLNTAMVVTSSGMQVVDARDLAIVHRFLLEHGTPAKPVDARYVVAGHFHPWADMVAIVEGITGQKVRAMRAPGAVFRFFGRACDLLRKIIPISFPMSTESMIVVTQWSPADSSRIETLSGIRFRPTEDTFRDTIRWQVEAGQLDARFTPVN
ncbi:MAG: SDR family NAD(P)-dependent oxidoreductase [Gammaproteobacteria bacterium]|nr:MAG: SDR family NAD(P)-dependent oxidoreductase [Gammaproteobacteria bacterium]